MNTHITAPRHFRFYGAVLAMAALLITLLAVTLTAGNTMAQTGTTDDYPNLSTYPNPQPCGPGAGTAFMEEPHEITSGHYALFDAYWRTISEGGGGIDGDGVLHTNLCPPEMVKKTKGEGREAVEVIARSARNGGMDVEEAIMHVLDKHEADVVATNAEATSGQLSLEEYPEVKEAVAAGDSVWWLRLDDPDTTGDETSDLGLGFSTALLDDEHWLTSADGDPMRYKFVVERHPADPTDVPHFFAYEAPDIRAESPSTGVKLVWDSFNPGEGVMELDPGEYRALQWVFTEPGTYLLWVHLLGDVRQANPHAQDHSDYDPNWKPISGNKTETSEVYRYTIQVGSELDEIEPPIFGVNLMVEENSPGGVKVGDPIPVYNADAATLYYNLTGDGHSDFDLVVASTDPHTVQIVVAEGASLDFETMPSYELNLSVTDKVDHEDNFNPYPDDVLIVKIDLKNQDPGVVLEVDNIFPAVGEAVNFVARYEPSTDHIAQEPAYEWAEMEQTLHDGVKYHVISSAPDAPTWSVSQSSAVTKTYRVNVVLKEGNIVPVSVHSEDVTIYWGR